MRPRNYTLEKSLPAASGVRIAAAVRDRDGAEVLLKCYAGDAAADPNARVRRELDMLRAVEGPGVPRGIELLTDVEPPILVVERVPGVSLSSWVASAPLAPDAFLAIAIDLAQILERVHGAGIIHGDVSPECVRVDPASLRACMVDFGSARMLGAVDRSRHGPSAALQRASLAYMAPEQTGRMGRGVDARSDLYALGALFYFALTGKPPFESDDPLALVHAHMARMPVPPLEHRPSLPSTLSRITIKLLQKEPSDRYQTARALARDLIVCRDELQRTGRISDELALGTADVPVRPLFSSRLYGRRAEIDALHAAYARIAGDAVELVLLSGAPGAGKSALVHELRPALVATGGYLAQGKFDLYRRDVPYSGLIAALESLTQQILSESEASVEHWRSVLQDALGSLASVVIDLVPDLRILLPEAPPVMRLGPRETQERLVYALKRLVLAGARAEHPLVIFLDDLQWADPGSRAVLEALLDQSRGASLLVVATCRDEDEGVRRELGELIARLEPRGVRVTPIGVDPLPCAAVAEMLADALGHSVDRVRSLAECVSSKTGSNPLWIQQFIGHVHELGLIQFVHPNGWTWDEEAIEGAEIPEEVVGLMVAKLERLATKPRSVIQFASCVGDELEVEMLCDLSGEPRDALEPALFELAKEGLLAPSARGFRFVHDRIREAAQALMSDAARSQLHYRTARHLLQHVPDASESDRVFEIADHLNRGIAHVSEDERRKALEINVAAGTRALGAGASRTALAYLEMGQRLLRPEDWDRDPQLTLRLHMQAAEAAYQTRAAERALQLLDALEERSWSRVEQAAIAAKRITYTIAARPAEAFDLTLREMRRFGIRLPARASFVRAWLSLTYTDWLLRKRPLDASGFGLRPGRDPAWFAPIQLLNAGGPALLRTGGFFMLCITTSRILQRFRRDGAPPHLSHALAGFAAQRIGLCRGFDGIERYIQAVHDWMERAPSPADVRTRFSLQCFTLPFLEPRRARLEPLAELEQAALEVGDREYAVYIRTNRWAQLTFCGEPLTRVLEELAALSASPDAQDRMPLYAAYGASYALLRDPEAADRDWTSPPVEVVRGLTKSHAEDETVALHWVMVLCYFGRFDEASALAARFTMRSFGVNPCSAMDAAMFRAICSSACAERRGRRARRRAARALRLSLFGIQGLIREASDFVHMRTVMQAERARLLGRDVQALALYQQAVKRAIDCAHGHHAALILERRASLLEEQRRDLEARTGLRQAVALYREWGALAKVEQLERRLKE